MWPARSKWNAAPRTREGAVEVVLAPLEAAECPEDGGLARCGSGPRSAFARARVETAARTRSGRAAPVRARGDSSTSARRRASARAGKCPARFGRASASSSVARASSSRVQPPAAVEVGQLDSASDALRRSPPARACVGVAEQVFRPSARPRDARGGRVGPQSARAQQQPAAAASPQPATRGRLPTPPRTPTNLGGLV